MGVYRVTRISDDEIKHYGIPGQKWGERNGPPYPLGQTQKSSREKKDRQKKIGMTIAAMALIGIAAYHMYNNGQLYKLIGIGKKKLKFGLDFQMFSSEKPMTIKEFKEQLKEFEGLTTEEIFEILGKYDRVDNYERVIEEIVDNIRDTEKSMELFPWSVGDYEYLVINHFDGTYDLLWAEQIENTLTGLTERDYKNDK